MGDDKSKGIILTNLRAADQFGRVVLPKEYVNAIGAPIENLRGALNEYLFHKRKFRRREC